MLIGIPKEVKDHEYRVGATPSLVKSLCEHGHEVMVEKGAGEKIGFSDNLYKSAGARIVLSAAEIYQAELVVKVKEPQGEEFALLKEGQILFCYLHLAMYPKLALQLLSRGVVAIAYETVTDGKGMLPLLTPMSEIAGRIAIQVGANYLQMANGGKGILLGGVPGVAPAKVTVIGGGTAGREAARIAIGMGGDVTVLDNNLSRLRELDQLFGSGLKTLFANSTNLEQAVLAADLVVGAVLVPGKLAPKLVSRQVVQKMEPGSVIVDVAIDQGGCFETSRPTTHSQPTYIEHGVVHYCVTNMTGICSRTATLALTYATTPYILALANKGYRKALLEDSGLMSGLNIWQGQVTLQEVAQELGYSYFPPRSSL